MPTMTFKSKIFCRWRTDKNLRSVLDFISARGCRKDLEVLLHYKVQNKPKHGPVGKVGGNQETSDTSIPMSTVNSEKLGAWVHHYCSRVSSDRESIHRSRYLLKPIFSAPYILFIISFVADCTKPCVMFGFENPFAFT